MPIGNQVSAVLTDLLGHLTAIQALLPFLISREPGDNNVKLGDKSVAFDEKCANYMASNLLSAGELAICLTSNWQRIRLAFHPKPDSYTN